MKKILITLITLINQIESGITEYDNVHREIKFMDRTYYCILFNFNLRRLINNLFMNEEILKMFTILENNDINEAVETFKK